MDACTDTEHNNMYLCMYVNVCVYVYMMYVNMCVRMHVCPYVCMAVCMYGRMYVYMYIRMYICMYVCMGVRRKQTVVCVVRTYVRMYVCMYACIYVCLLDKHKACTTAFTRLFNNPRVMYFITHDCQARIMHEAIYARMPALYTNVCLHYTQTYACIIHKRMPARHTLHVIIYLYSAYRTGYTQACVSTAKAKQRP